MAADIEPVLQDLTFLDWSESAVSSATGGSYLKARQGEGAEAVYYKLSCYDESFGIYGHESVNELIAARLMDILCIQHVPYRLVHALVKVNGINRETWLAESPSFRKSGESKTSLARFFDLNKLDGESRIDFCTRFGWQQAVQQAMLVDYLIGNRDRHGGNLEVIKGRDGKVRLAPLFDNGLCLCYSTFNASQIHEIDPQQDIESNNYLGSQSLENNLVSFVPSQLPIGRLSDEHAGKITGDLAPALEGAIDGMSGQEFASKLWKFLWERWCRYESLRDSRRLQTQS